MKIKLKMKNIMITKNKVITKWSSKLGIYQE